MERDGRRWRTRLILATAIMTPVSAVAVNLATSTVQTDALWWVVTAWTAAVTLTVVAIVVQYRATVLPEQREMTVDEAAQYLRRAVTDQWNREASRPGRSC